MVGLMITLGFPEMSFDMGRGCQQFPTVSSV